MRGICSMKSMKRTDTMKNMKGICKKLKNEGYKESKYEGYR